MSSKMDEVSGWQRQATLEAIRKLGALPGWGGDDEDLIMDLSAWDRRLAGMAIADRQLVHEWQQQAITWSKRYTGRVSGHFKESFKAWEKQQLEDNGAKVLYRWTAGAYRPDEVAHGAEVPGVQGRGCWAGQPFGGH